MKFPKPNRSTKFGTLSVLLALVLLVLLVAVNLLVSLIPTRYTLLDASYNDLYTVSETTESYIKALNEDVTLYFLCDDGAEDATLRTFLDRYAGLSSHIAVKVIDPVASPTFTAQYTDATLNNYSVIVESEKRAICLDYYEFYLFENEVLGILTAEEYTTYLSSSTGSYYLSYYETTEHFNGEAKLTNAITYVTSDEIPKIYALSGHGEAALGSDFCTTLNAATYEIVTELSLFSVGGVPADCDILLVNAPSKDLSEQESEWIGEYLENGGKLFLTTSATLNYTDTVTVTTDENGNETTETVKGDFPYLTALLGKYGLSATNGTVAETESSLMMSASPLLLFPNKNTDHAIVSGASGSAMLFWTAHGITLDETVEGVTLSSLFTTSNGSYITEIDSDGNYEKAEGALEGPFTLGATAEKGETRIVWFASANALDDNVDAYVSGGNHDFALSACDFLIEKGDTVILPSVSLEEPMLIITDDTLKIFAVFFCGVIPFSILIGGLVFWLRRRRA